MNIFVYIEYLFTLSARLRFEIGSLFVIDRATFTLAFCTVGAVNAELDTIKSAEIAVMNLTIVLSSYGNLVLVVQRLFDDELLH